MSDIEVAGLVTKISIDDSQIDQSMASLNRQMQIAKSQATMASAGMHAFGNSTQALRQKSDNLSKQLQIQGTRVAKLQAEMNDESKAKERNTEQTHRLQMQLNKAIAEYNRLDGQLQATNRELAIQESRWTQVGNQLESAGKKMQEVGKGMESAGKSMTKSVTVPIMAAGAAIVKFGSDFEKSMVGSTAIMGNVSDEMQSKMEKAAREVAKNTRFSATQAAESYFFLASAGLDAAQSIEALPRVAAFAQAGNFNMARATDLLTDAQSALGLAVDDTAQNMENMTRVSDVLVKANTIANASVEQFAASLTSKAGNALQAVGKDIEEGAAALGIFADQGIKGETAGTLLTNTIFGLADRARVSQRDFRRLGIEVFDLDGNMNNLADIAADLERAFGGLSDEQKLAELAALGFNKQAREGILALMGNSDALRDYERQLRSAGGTTDEVAAKQIKNLQDQLGLMKDRAIDSALTMYDTLGPTIENVVIPMFGRLLDNLERATEWFANLDEGTQANILRMIAFAAAAGPTLVVTGKLVGSLGAISTSAGAAAKFIGIKTAATATMGTATASAAGSTGLLSKGLIGLAGGAGPLALAAAGIGLVGFGAYSLYKNLQNDAIPAVRDFGDEVSDSTKKAVNGFLDLYDQADTSLRRLQWSGETISRDMAKTLSGNFDSMSSQIIGSLEDSRKEGVASLQKLFAESKDISEAEQKAMLDALNEGYDQRINTINEQNARIAEILETASNERRELTRAEQNEIARIQEQMKNTAIATMSDGELEQRAILERMKADAENFSARQAAEVVKNSKEQKQKTVAEAEAQYNESIKQIIFLRDDAKSITREQADSLIREAKRQRDGVVGHAEDMHDTVVKEAQKRAGELVSAVDWETGEILSRWEILKQGWKNLQSTWSQNYMSQSMALSAPRPSAPKPASTPYVWQGDEFDDGGIVPGPIGAPRLILAHGGETVLPTHKQGFAQRVHHTFDPLTVHGVNDKGELVAVVDMRVEKVVKDLLYWEGR